MSEMRHLDCECLQCYICGDENLNENDDCNVQFRYDCSNYAKNFPLNEEIFCRTMRRRTSNGRWENLLDCFLKFWIIILEKSNFRKLILEKSNFRKSIQEKSNFGKLISEKSNFRKSIFFFRFITCDCAIICKFQFVRNLYSQS